DQATGKFKEPSFNEALNTVSSGTSIARATVLDIVRQDNSPANDDLRAFVSAVEKQQPLNGSLSTQVRPQCSALEDRLDKLVNMRDAAHVYWAFLKKNQTEILKYADGTGCGDGALTGDFSRYGLALGAEWNS